MNATGRHRMCAGAVACVVAALTLPVGTAQAAGALAETEALADPISLSKPYYFFTGLKPASVTTADFDEDGNVDIVTANSQSDDLGVLFGQGGGRFARAEPIEVADNPGVVVAADFDGDRHQDLAVTAGLIYVLLGDGLGGFSALPGYPVGLSPNDLVAADFNDDGVPDLVTTNLFAGDPTDLAVSLGVGDGTFEPAVGYDIGAPARNVAVGDLDRDGVLDLVLTQFTTSTVLVLLGDGAGGFGAPSETSVVGAPRGVALGDFDGDGRLDAAVTTDDVNIAVLRGNGRGGLTAERSFRAVPGTYALVAADMNEDGLDDLVASAGTGFLDEGNRSITVIINDRGVGFLDPVVVRLQVRNVTPPTIADLDGNGTLDIAFAGGNGQQTMQRGGRVGVLFQTP